MKLKMKITVVLVLTEIYGLILVFRYISGLVDLFLVVFNSEYSTLPLY